VGDSIEKAVLLLIPPNLADKKDGVYDQSCDQHTEENDAENKWHHLPPVKNDPADVEGDRQGNKTSPESDEERDGFGAARDAHSVLVYAREVLAPAKKGRDDVLQIWRSMKRRSIKAGAV
jgi:hypothetical protein